MRDVRVTWIRTSARVWHVAVHDASVGLISRTRCGAHVEVRAVASPALLAGMLGEVCGACRDAQNEEVGR